MTMHPQRRSDGNVVEQGFGGFTESIREACTKLNQLTLNRDQVEELIKIDSEIWDLIDWVEDN